MQVLGGTSGYSYEEWKGGALGTTFAQRFTELWRAVHGERPSPT